MSLTPDAKKLLGESIRGTAQSPEKGLRARLLRAIHDEADRRYQLSVPIAEAGLDETHRRRRERIEAWLDEGARATKAKNKAEQKAAKDRLLAQAEKEAAATLVNRLVLLRHLEALKLSKPAVLTGGWSSAGYRAFREFAPTLCASGTSDATEGYATLLQLLFDELALDLPGLFGDVGLTRLFPIPPAALRDAVERLDDPALTSAWTDDTTLGWVYQYWNDPDREALDAKIAGGGKIQPHEIASKTQMFTERYMVEWLLQNSLGLTWLCMCRKHGWTPDAERVLPVLDARRAAWRAEREAGNVALDALMPIEGELEHQWKYYVPQPLPEEAVAKAPDSVRAIKVLDPACGSGHFLVIAFGQLAALYREEARHRGETVTDREIAESIVENNLHGIDIDPRAVQIAAAAMYLKARSFAKNARPKKLNLVAPVLQLGNLPPDDPAVAQLRKDLQREVGIPEALTHKLLAALAGVDHLGSLLKVDAAVEQAIRSVEAEFERGGGGQGDLFGGFKPQQVKMPLGAAKASILDKLEGFLAKHSKSEDLGLRLDGEQLAAGVRFVRMVKEGVYDVVVGNPPYQGLSKTDSLGYVTRNYPRGKADLYAAFLERGLELAKPGGVSAMVTMRGWMFLGKGELRKWLLKEHDLRVLGDVDRGAFEDVADEVLATVMSVIRRTPPQGVPTIVIQPTPTDDRARDSQRTARKRAAVLVQRARLEFDPRGFEVIDGQPIVYWWTKEFLQKYAEAPQLGEVSPARATQGLYNNTRFTRWWHEMRPSRISETPNRERPWTPFANGSDGANWFDPLRLVALWGDLGMEVKVYVSTKISTAIYRFANEQFFFRDDGVAFASIGSSFGARAVRRRGIFGNKGRCVFAASPSNCLCLLNSSFARSTMQSLNPGVGFEVGDVNRLPLFPIESAIEIFSEIERAFSEHEATRENSVEYRKPGPSPWTYAQLWAQLAVDRPAGEPLPEYIPQYEPPSPVAFVSFALGVAFGRFDVTSPPNPLSRGGEGEPDASRRVVRDMGRYVNPKSIEAARNARKAPTEAEAQVWELIRGRRCYNLKFRREQVIDGLRADFYCPSARVVVEIDGGIHDDPDQAEYDRFRSRHFESIGLRVLRVRNEDVSAETFLRLLSPTALSTDTFSQSSSGSPSPSRERGLGGEVTMGEITLGEVTMGLEAEVTRAEVTRAEVTRAEVTRAEVTLPAGIFFLSSEAADSHDHSSCVPLRTGWAEHSSAIGEGDDLRMYLRKSFFDYHKKLYDNRPIYFPLSSSKKSFVAFVSIHRWQDNTLTLLLADHLVPAQRRLENELNELRVARASGANKGKAEKRFTDVQKLLEELADFIAKVTEIAERGAPPPDDKTPRREVDARFVMDLDDGVMVNSAALWPLLEPQWKDPRKWWKELATATGKKDYDWSHLAARYFPSRVRTKCETDPSLGVAHGCFWELHPAKAYAWELRLQDEIRPDFTIDERGSYTARAKFLAERWREADEIRANELKRRARKAAKAEDESESGPLFDGDAEETEESADE